MHETETGRRDNNKLGCTGAVHIWQAPQGGTLLLDERRSAARDCPRREQYNKEVARTGSDTLVCCRHPGPAAVEQKLLQTQEQRRVPLRSPSISNKKTLNTRLPKTDDKRMRPPKWAASFFYRDRAILLGSFLHLLCNHCVCNRGCNEE